MMELPEPIKLPPEPLSPEAQSRAYALLQEMTRSIRDQRDSLRRELRDARSLLAAVVRQHGEHYGHGDDGRFRLAVTMEALDSVDGMSLRVILEPNSGAVLLRLGPPTA